MNDIQNPIQTSLVWFLDWKGQTQLRKQDRTVLPEFLCWELSLFERLFAVIRVRRVSYLLPIVPLGYVEHVLLEKDKAPPCFAPRIMLRIIVKFFARKRTKCFNKFVMQVLPLQSLQFTILYYATPRCVVSLYCKLRCVEMCCVVCWYRYSFFLTNLVTTARAETTNWSFTFLYYFKV